MNKIIYRSVIMTALLSLVLFSTVSCEDKTVETPPSGFSLARNVVEVPVGGGVFEVKYLLENPVEGAVPVPETEAGWIHDFDVSVQGAISFTVDSSDVEEVREAVVEVVYGEEDAQTFKVIQDAADPALAIEILDTKVVSFIVKTTPQDMEMPFYVGCELTEEVGDMSDEELMAFDMKYFQSLMEQNGLTLERLLNLMLDNGTDTRQPNYLEPGTSYTFYAYGLDYSGEPLTRIYRQEVTTGSFDFNCDVTFDISVGMDELMATVNVVPSDNSQLYRVSATIGDETEEEMLIQSQAYIDALIFMMMYAPDGNSAALEEILRANFPSGPSSQQMGFQEPEKDGRVLVWAIDNQGRIVSEAHVKEFRTGKVNLSDNDIVIEVPVVEVRKAEYSVSTTNNDPYVFYFDEASVFEGLTDDEIIEKVLLQDVSRNIMRGPSKGQLSNMIRNTDYLLLAFGYEGGVVTTGLSKCGFTTLDESVSDVTCELPIDKYFDGDDIAAAYPDELGWAAGMVVVPVSPVVSGDPAKYYYHIWEASWADEEAYHDDKLISWLLSGGVSLPEMTFYTMFDQPRCVIAVAQDTDGTFGPVYRQPITFTKEGCSPVEEFVPASASSEYLLIPKTATM